MCVLSMNKHLPGGRKRAVPLRAQERELCASARLLPAHYLAMKAALMRESARRGYLPRAAARTMLRCLQITLALSAFTSADERASQTVVLPGLGP